MTTAKERYETLHSRRDQVLERAREAAELTIPSIAPPEGADENTVLPQPYQSLGARGVNNLASKLLLALLPPDSPFFRFALDDEVLDRLGAKKGDIEESLRRLENRLTKKIETRNFRTMIHNALKNLIVTGNALLFLPNSGGARMYRLNQYVVVRDPNGTIMEIVIKESAHPATLDEKVRAQASLDPADGTKKSDDYIDIYTHVVRKGDKVEWHQEINEIRIDGSDGRAKASESPYIALRWTAVENEDYGRGMVEEYIGDLRSLDGLSQAILGFSAVAAKIIFLLHPNATTDEDHLKDAESGDVVVGNAEEIDILSLEKFADFRVAKGVIDDLTLRLSHAFLLRSGTVRDAERVTAEEIRAQAQELEDVLGGVYTVQTQELQLPLLRRLMAIMRKEGELPTLPRPSGNRQAVEPLIITGFEALGRGHQLNRLRQFFQDQVALFGPAVMEEYDRQEVGRCFATAQNVDIEELLRDPVEVAEERRQARTQALAEKAAGPVAGAVASAATQRGD